MNNASLYRLNTYGLLKVAGDGAAKLLQGQLTYNVEKIDGEHTSLAAICNPKGRVISLFYLFLHDNAYYLCMPKSLLSITFDTLKKYAVFYKVTLEMDSTDFTCYGLVNTENQVYEGIFIPITPDKHYALLMRSTATDEIDKSIEWKKLIIAQGIPTIYAETSALFLPHELNLPDLQAISFDKGCYTGQEIIARMHYRGNLKKHMMQQTLHSEKTLLPGTDIAEGMIVDAYSTKANAYQALIVAEKNHATNR